MYAPPHFSGGGWEGVHGQRSKRQEQKRNCPYKPYLLKSAELVTNQLIYFSQNYYLWLYATKP
jgi:hypothetical protein